MRAKYITTALAIASLLAISIPTNASHTQQGVTFKHDGGNEWWVELQLGGSYAEWTATPPYVRDDGGAWKAMTRPSWAPNAGFFAVSYHVEPGHRVQFRLEKAGDALHSCMFTHPAGVEQCDAAPGGATFTPRGGEYEIAVHVAWEKNVSAVSYHVPAEFGGHMTRGSDPGVWYKSTGNPQDITVRFEAEADDGTRALSGCFHWPSKTAVQCPSPYPAFVYEPFQVDADTIGVEANGEPSPAGVDVRFDGGSFHAMTRQSGDFRPWTYDGAPTSGDHVAEFRIKASDGRVRCDEFGYHWPPDEEHSRVGVDGPIVFANAKGNTNWIQINTYSVPNVVAVDVQVNAGPWKPLKLQSYCDWAAAIEAPAGSTVTFRAFRPDLSGEYKVYTWPPTEGDPPGDRADTYYDHGGGNEWWVEVDIEWDSKFPDSVHACDSTGECKRLEFKSWGEWAGSFHIDGAVRFHAVAYGGMSDVYNEWSCWFTHPEGKTPTGGEVCAGTENPDAEPDPDPPTSFDATFKNVRGNNYWVETDVAVTGGTLAGVDARKDGGSWIALTKRSYGSYAKSFYVQTGSDIEFRARATDGSTDISSAYRWPPG